MLWPSAVEEKQRHYSGQKAQWSGWGHSEIVPVETLMLLLTWLALETTPAGTPKNRTVKSHWAVRQERGLAEGWAKNRPALSPRFWVQQRGHTGEMWISRNIPWGKCIPLYMLILTRWRPSLHSLPFKHIKDRWPRTEGQQEIFVLNLCWSFTVSIFPQLLPCKSFNALLTKWHHFMARCNDVTITCWGEKSLFHYKQSREPVFNQNTVPHRNQRKILDHIIILGNAGVVYCKSSRFCFFF